jgi:hypothetical protein
MYSCHKGNERSIAWLFTLHSLPACAAAGWLLLCFALNFTTQPSPHAKLCSSQWTAPPPPIGEPRPTFPPAPKTRTAMISTATSTSASSLSCRSPPHRRKCRLPKPRPPAPPRLHPRRRRTARRLRNPIPWTCLPKPRPQASPCLHPRRCTAPRLRSPAPYTSRGPGQNHPPRSTIRRGLLPPRRRGTRWRSRSRAATHPLPRRPARRCTSASSPGGPRTRRWKPRSRSCRTRCPRSSTCSSTTISAPGSRAASAAPNSSAPPWLPLPPPRSTGAPSMGAAASRRCPARSRSTAWATTPTPSRSKPPGTPPVATAASAPAVVAATRRQFEAMWVQLWVIGRLRRHPRNCGWLSERMDCRSVGQWEVAVGTVASSHWSSSMQGWVLV